MLHLTSMSVMVHVYESSHVIYWKKVYSTMGVQRNVLWIQKLLGSISGYGKAVTPPESDSRYHQRPKHMNACWLAKDRLGTYGNS